MLKLVFHYYRLFGILPVTENKNVKLSDKTKIQYVQYKVSRRWLLIPFTLTSVNIHLLYVLISSLMNITRRGLYFKAGLLSFVICASNGIFYYTFTITFKILDIISCFNDSFIIMYEEGISTAALGKPSLLFPQAFTFMIIAIKMFLNVYYGYVFNKQFISIVLFNMSLFTVAGTESIISFMALIAENCFKKINQRLKVDKHRTITTELLTEMMKLHWKTGNFIERVNYCFGGQLFVLTVCLVSYSFLSIYAVLVLIFYSTYSYVHFYWIFNVAFNLSWAVAIITHLAYRSHRMCESSKKTLIYLRNLSCERAVPMELAHVVGLFSDQIRRRDVYISARGFFNYDLSLLLSIASAMLTYMVAILQLQSTQN